MSKLIDSAVQILQRGGLVAFPTETVYGLGANARDPMALQKIFAAKERPVDHPLIVHIANKDQLSVWASNISPMAFQLAEAFWPGPLTIILKKAPDVCNLVTGNQETIGLRVPKHPVAQALLEQFNGGIAAPSANRFGRISPTTAEAVREELGLSVDLILEGGDCEVGLESTIVDLSGEHPAILRPGMITVQQLEEVVRVPVLLSKKNAPRVSGSLESHYAPQTNMILLERDEIISYVEKTQFPIAVLVRSVMASLTCHTILMPSQAQNYAHDLYQTLRTLDHQGFSQLIVEKVPDDIEWAGIRDRLQRAAGEIKKGT